MSCLYEIRTKSLEPAQVLSIRFTTNFQKMSEDIPNAFHKLCEAITNWSEQVHGSPFTLYHDTKFDPNKIDAEVCIPLQSPTPIPAGATLRDLPAYQVAASTHKGSYKDMEDIYHSIFSWIEANGKKQTGPIRETYLNNPKETPESDLLTEVAVPI